MTFNQFRENMETVRRNAKKAPASAELRLMRVFIRHASNDELNEFIRYNRHALNMECTHRSLQESKWCSMCSLRKGVLEAQQALWQVSPAARMYTDYQRGVLL